MRKITFLIALVSPIVMLGIATQEQEQAQWTLRGLESENYRYSEADGCMDCKQSSDDIMTRAIGVDISSGSPVSNGQGWLSGVHANSLSHDEMNTHCTWCHSPTMKDVIEDEDAGVPIEIGGWQGVTCTACHPGLVRREVRKSTLANLKPGADLADPQSYIFYDKSDPKQFDAQCRYCHHDSHELTSEAKRAMVESGKLRCIDCHMAGYRQEEGRAVERFHDLKVEAHLPYSCNGAFGAVTGCHTDASVEKLKPLMATIKGPRKEW
ncbi:MAG TPA: hypothetical protein VMX35_03025 [Acidobacteriota bacterium]|nr:hypothetical protein [Acidobacteriota bacterium]